MIHVPTANNAAVVMGYTAFMAGIIDALTGLANRMAGFVNKKLWNTVETPVVKPRKLKSAAKARLGPRNPGHKVPMDANGRCWQEGDEVSEPGSVRGKRGGWKGD